MSRVIGTNARRSDGEDKVRGAAVYGMDYAEPGMLHAALLRSPVAAGRIRSIDTTRAAAMPGVHAIVSAADVPDTTSGWVLKDQPIFAREEVRFIGEPVAAVAADTAEQARAAVAAIELELDELEQILDLEQSLEPGQRVIHPKWEAYGTLAAEETESALDFLVSHKVLHETNGMFHWAADAYPANNVSLRSVGWDNVVIIDREKDKTIAEIDWRGAHTMVHEQAIYQHDGECWQVELFDYENHKAFVKKVKPDYWTDAMTYVTVNVMEEFGTAELNRWPSGWGEVSVVEKVVCYKKIKFYTHENAGYGDVRLPEMQMHTTAFWLTVPEDVVAEVPMGRAATIDGLRGVGIALETVSTLALMCDPRDLGTTMGSADLDETNEDGTPIPRKERGALRVPTGADPRGYCPTVFLYEHTLGGIGLAERIFADRHQLLVRAFHLIRGCSCVEGCPACVGPAGDPLALPQDKREKEKQTGRKATALFLLRRLLGGSTEIQNDAAATS